jgi:dinuclear metal center YbgI/SA1388 family protein
MSTRCVGDAMKLESLLQYLDEYLGVADHPDYPSALNGLQVQGRPEVSCVATAVDASLASIEAAAARGADLLIVHHGLFWDGLRPVVGRRFRRLKTIMDAGLSVYSCHLPLDGHTEIGNCILLAKAMGLETEGRFGRYQGADLGWRGRLGQPVGVEELRERVAEAVGGGSIRVLEGGPGRVETVGVLTGGGGSFAREAAEAGLDAFVTGEGAHHHFFDAAECGIHVLFAGHYATETFGVRALGEHLAERFGLESGFIDQPTGL